MRTRGDVRPAPGVRSAQSADDARPTPDLNRPMARAQRRRIRIGIDTGGTFTDVVAVDEDSGELATTKAPSTPGNPADGFIAGLEKILSVLGADGQDVTAVSHGTTVATNTLLEGRVDRLGFVTTEGYEFVLEIARQAVPDGYGNSYFWVKPPRIVAADHVRTVGGRMDFEGNEIRPFDEDSLVAAAVKPAVSRYVSNIRVRLDGFTGGRTIPFSVMKSNGGVLSADEVVHQPITTVLSGPAAGALGAALIARRAGFAKVLTCDGGGTSTDVSVGLDGEPTLTTEGTIGAYPSKIPMIDVVTVGAGGGSVAWVSPEGALKVGPRSAGADPGPLCYDAGGTEPTVTDAHVVLGRIPPHLLGGEIPLDVDAARRGVERLAADLHLDVERCATGILEISAWNQANALRQVSVKRGLDIRDFVLTTFGGSGSLLACRLVDVLDLAGALVPQDPGTVSAFGLLTVDVRNDYVQTLVARHAGLDHPTVEKVFDELTAKAAAALDTEGFARIDHDYVRTADLRYFGQAYEVRVAAAPGRVDEAYAAAVADRFHDEHRSLYGYDFRDDPRQQVEWVNLRVTGVGPITRPELRPLPGRQASSPPSATVNGVVDALGARSTRAVCFDADAGYVPAEVYWRPDLRADDTIRGPAVIEEFGSTVPVHPGFAVRVDAYGNLVVTKEAS